MKQTQEIAEVQLPVDEIKKHIQETIISADQIVFEEDLDAIEEVVDVSEEKQRFGIESQTNDLLDELLSTVPNSERTHTVLNQIHTTIERFKQLREKFSTFDKDGNPLMPIKKGADYKPLVDKLAKLNSNLYWILPVVKNSRKLYDIDEGTDIEPEDYPDVISLTLAQYRIAEDDIIENYQSNEIPSGIGKYNHLYSELNNYLTPFGPPSYDSDVIAKKTVSENIHVVLDNLEDFYSSVVDNDLVKRRRFVIQKYNLSETRLQTTEISNSKMMVKRVPITKNDTAYVRSVMTLPESAVRFSKIKLPGTNILERSELNNIHLNFWQSLRNRTSITTQTVYKS